MAFFTPVSNVGNLELTREVGLIFVVNSDTSSRELCKLTVENGDSCQHCVESALARGVAVRTSAINAKM